MFIVTEYAALSQEKSITHRVYCSKYDKGQFIRYAFYTTVWFRNALRGYIFQKLLLV